METLKDYTICCTEEQTKKALELGAPIKYKSEVYYPNGAAYPVPPTAEQMSGWLRKEHNIFFTPKKVGDNNYVLIGDLRHFQSYGSYEEATLAGIDVALEYLSKNNLIK